MKNGQVVFILSNLQNDHKLTATTRHIISYLSSLYDKPLSLMHLNHNTCLIFWATTTIMKMSRLHCITYTSIGSGLIMSYVKPIEMIVSWQFRRFWAKVNFKRSKDWKSNNVYTDNVYWWHLIFYCGVIISVENINKYMQSDTAITVNNCQYSSIFGWS